MPHNQLEDKDSRHQKVQENIEITNRVGWKMNREIILIIECCNATSKYIYRSSSIATHVFHDMGEKI